MEYLKVVTFHQLIIIIIIVSCILLIRTWQQLQAEKKTLFSDLISLPSNLQFGRECKQASHAKKLKKKIEKIVMRYKLT